MKTREKKIFFILDIEAIYCYCERIKTKTIISYNYNQQFKMYTYKMTCLNFYEEELYTDIETKLVLIKVSWPSSSSSW